MAEFENNLWAPWRMAYIRQLAGDDPHGCFLCHYRDHPSDDELNGVLWRGADVLVMLNRFPYAPGHLLIAPTAHEADMAALPEATLTRMMLCIRDAQRVLRESASAQGFNVGMNLGRCAGAGLPDHLHWHIVPRWGGDTNFMTVVGDARVMPESLEATAAAFRSAAGRLGLLTGR